VLPDKKHIHIVPVAAVRAVRSSSCLQGEAVVTPKKNATLFLSFPYVCPEPVLVNRSFLYINGSKSGVFRTNGR
jgi:hypothetical protein